MRWWRTSQAQGLFSSIDVSMPGAGYGVDNNVVACDRGDIGGSVAQAMREARRRYDATPWLGRQRRSRRDQLRRRGRVELPQRRSEPRASRGANG